MRNRIPDEAETEQELSLQNRLVTAFLAPVIFNFSIVIVYLVIRSWMPYRTKFVLNHINWPVALMVLVPAFAGYLMGTSRFAVLLGHCFYTNSDDEKDWRITAVLWAVMLFVAFLWARR